ncbi:MAG: hypothetical protein HY017_02425 [Betaproteobacteria bacterium]|nr:hypothetical protein [Betaproteobacteria bacterium]
MSKSAGKGKRNAASADPDLSAIPAVRLQAEPARRQRRARNLLRRHDRLLEAAKALKAEIAALGGVIVEPATGGLAPRPCNQANLVQTLKRVLSHKPLSVTEAAEAALKAGYRTTSPSFRQIFNSALIRSGEFERVGRGRYQVK